MATSARHAHRWAPQCRHVALVPSAAVASAGPAGGHDPEGVLAHVKSSGPEGRGAPALMGSSSYRAGTLRLQPGRQ